MTVVFMTNPDTGHCALYDEASGGGDPQDAYSLRNRPLIDPEGWLANIYFHTQLDNLEVESSSTTTVSHSSISATTDNTQSGAGSSGGSGAPSGSNSAQTSNGLGYGNSTTHVLTTHDLGYIPDFMVVLDDEGIFPGKIIQTNSDGRARYITVYATTTQIILQEWSSVTTSALASVSKNYLTIVFRQQRSISGDILIGFDETTGIVEMGRSRFRSDRRYLQVVPGGSPFAIAYGKTIDLNQGAIRVVNPDGTYLEPIDVNQAARFVVSYAANKELKTYTGAYGNDMGYEGSFTGPQQILVQAP